MAITRTQIAKQLLANGGRIGFRGGGAARSDAASGRDASRARSRGTVERGGGRDPSVTICRIQFAITKETRDRFNHQRKEARFQITPSTKPRNRIISGLLSAFVPFGGLLFNKAIDQTSNGF